MIKRELSNSLVGEQARERVPDMIYSTVMG